MTWSAMKNTKGFFGSALSGVGKGSIFGLFQPSPAPRSSTPQEIQSIVISLSSFMESWSRSQLDESEEEEDDVDEEDGEKADRS
jgi:hypothetical protein